MMATATAMAMARNQAELGLEKQRLLVGWYTSTYKGNRNLIVSRDFGKTRKDFEYIESL